jgi:hypothetical protein
MVLRGLCTAAGILLLLSSVALAQDGLRSASLPERTPMNPIPPEPRDLFRARPETYTPRPQPFPPVFGGYVTDGYSPRRSRRSKVSSPDIPANGYLELRVEPSTAQVFIDGLYVGTVDDLRRQGGGKALESGSHRVELRASGYESLWFDVRIDSHETTTYRNDLKPVAVPLPPVTRVGPPPAPKTFYVIPGCYAGDTRPNPARLPRGCSAAKLRAIPPIVRQPTSRREG